MEQKYIVGISVVLAALILVIIGILLIQTGTEPFASFFGTSPQNPTTVDNQNQDITPTASDNNAPICTDVNCGIGDTNVVPNDTTTGNEMCGNTICEPNEINSGSCPKDCE